MTARSKSSRRSRRPASRVWIVSGSVSRSSSSAAASSCSMKSGLPPPSARIRSRLPRSMLPADPSRSRSTCDSSCVNVSSTTVELLSRPPPHCGRTSRMSGRARRSTSSGAWESSTVDSTRSRKAGAAQWTSSSDEEQGMAAGQAREQPARRERHVAGLRDPGGKARGGRELLRELHAVVGTELLAEPLGRIAVGEGPSRCHEAVRRWRSRIRRPGSARRRLWPVLAAARCIRSRAVSCPTPGAAKTVARCGRRPEIVRSNASMISATSRSRPTSSVSNRRTNGAASASTVSINHASISLGCDGVPHHLPRSASWRGSRRAPPPPADVSPRRPALLRRVVLRSRPRHSQGRSAPSAG